MNERTVTAGMSENMGEIGRKPGQGARSDLSGRHTPAPASNGLETTDKSGTERKRPRVFGMVSDVVGRMIGDPVPLIVPEKDFSSTASNATIAPTVKELLVDLDAALVQPDVVIVNGQRYVHEERIEEAKAPTVAGDKLLSALSLAKRIVFATGREGLGVGDRERVLSVLSDAFVEIVGLRGDVRSAEAGADDWKTRALQAEGVMSEADYYTRPAEAVLGDRVICADCGATLATYADACTADLATQCPGFVAIENAVTEGRLRKAAVESFEEPSNVELRGPGRGSFPRSHRAEGKNFVD